MIYQFGGYIFDADGGELRRGGEAIPTEPQALKVLGYLIAHRHRVVSRDELFEQCWPDSYVSDSSLTSCLSRLRRALGQTRSGPMFIQTLHRRGYRFIGEVTEVAEPVDAPPPSPADLAAPVVPSSADHAAASDLSTSSSQPRSDASEHAVTTERRHLSVLSCALCDLDTLTETLDPEDHYALMQAFFSGCERVVSAYGGYVAGQSDGEFRAYFGYPQAQEDAAQQAVRTALALVEAVGRDTLATGALPGVCLGVRVGVASGVMIIPSQGVPEGTFNLGVGRTSTRAVRLSALAEPDTVVIDADVARLVTGYFECKVLDDATLAASGEPGRVYTVLGESGLETRLEVASAQGLTPFVGREAEMALLQDRWAYVQEGMGQVVWIQGEAGMGKSRLVQMWQEQVGDALSLVWSCRCSPYHQHTALYPLVELLQRMLYEALSPSPAAQLKRLEALLGQYGFALAETVPLLADLVTLPLPVERYVPLNLTPQRQRERTLETLVALLVAQAAASPVLFVVEDLHWADPSTLEFLALLMQQVATVSLLVVLTCRPEFRVPWEQQTTMTPVVLQRLTRPQTEEMIRQVAAGKQLPAVVVEQMIEKTDGVPLFVEELTRMVLELGQLVERDGQYELIGELTQPTIPATLHDSLMARLDRLGMPKAIAQWGSVLGRAFTYDVLSAVTPFDEATLQEGLRQLVQAELLFQRGLLPQVHYRFKHALIQDAAYASLLRCRRQAMHAQVARVLETQFPQIAVTEPEVVAHHYTQAGLHEQAILYWWQAGQRAGQRSAHVEAIQHLRQGLTLLKELPETTERLHQELDLQVALGQALIATKGNASLEAECAYTRAQELCQQVGDAPQLFTALRGLILYYQARGLLQTAHQLAEQMLRLAQSLHDPTLVMFAHYNLGVGIFYRGELAAAHTHHAQALAIYTPKVHRALATRYGIDLGVGSHNFLALELWSLGYPDQAMRHSQATRTLAQQVSHPYSLGTALLNAARVYQACREAKATHEQTAALMRLATDQGFAYHLARGMVLHGWALVMLGRGEAGIAEIRQGLAAHLATGAKSGQTYFLGLLAEAYGASGHTEAGLEVLAEALVEMEITEVRFYAAELYRLKGALLLKRAPPDAPQAEACFQQALDIARQQEARSWELRAATSLARLWQSQDKRREAYDLLSPVYGWFTEGFDTADLQEAKVLLDELAR
jgi:DNA-binding winged helix-turn-helix (wHTH) protein/predicted ATPase